MIALINEEGELKIMSENPLEGYALKCWWENFHQGNEKSILHIITPAASMET